MRKLIILVFTIFFSVIAYSQQFPLQSQYQFNYSVINPSVIVENNFTSIRGSFRQQWVGFSENPIATQYLSLYKGFGKNGLGINVFNDETGGALNKTGLSLSYAHKVVFSESELYFGVSGGAAKINISNISDPAIVNSEDIYPEVLFGAYFKKNDFRFGISIPGLLNQNIEITNSNENTLKRNLYTMISYEYEIKKDIILLPSILVKANENTNQVDANINLKFRDKIWVGTSYRQDFGISLFVGLDLGKLFSIYSYDVSTNDIYTYSKGSHEFTIGYDFNSNIDSTSSKISTKIEEFLDDRDNDGVKDSVDLCPDEFGSLRAHGCIDTDNDGIPNKYDLCPNLYGEINLQGCPMITQFEKNIVYNALNDLNFDFDKAEINYSSFSTLTDMNVLLLKNPNMFLHITGFSSSEGSEDYNLGLSARRAKEVQNFFIKRGVKKSRLILDYYGESKPLNNNQTEIQKSLNRRVEFSLEYHIYDISEAKTLKMKYIDELNNKNLNSDFLNFSKEKSKIDLSIFNDNNSSLINKTNDESIEEFLVDSIEENSEESIKESSEESIQKPSELTIQESFIEKSIKENSLASKKFILVIAVLSNKSNLDKYLSNSSLAKYILIDNKYYIFEESNDSKEELSVFKKSYSKESWIKEVN